MPRASRQIPQSQSTQSNLTQSQLDQSQHDVAELQELVVITVKYYLNQSVTKLPIKRADIIKHCLNGNSRIAPKVQSVAAQHLLETYGITVVESDEVKSVKQFLCISNITAKHPQEYNKLQQHNIALLTIVLSYIYMKGGTVSENAMMEFLQRFDIFYSQPHSYFGNVKKLMTETFVRQQYLRRQKIAQEAGNSEKILISWGQRAMLEFPKKDVLNAVAKLYNKPTICFMRQHHEIYGNQGEEDVEMNE